MGTSKAIKGLQAQDAGHQSEARKDGNVRDSFAESET
jgi:hypothetical protein